MTITALASCGQGKHSPLLNEIAAAGEPIDWVTVPAACFTMGEHQFYPEEGPKHKTCVDEFAIAAHEITNGQFAKFVADTGYVTRAERGWDENEPGWDAPQIPPGSTVFVPDGAGFAMLDWWHFIPGASWRTPDGVSHITPQDAQLPVVHIALEDARAFATWAGASLASETQWEYAARGGLDGEIYSWANAANTQAAEMANTWQGLFPKINTGEDGHVGVAPVGQYPPNGFGLHDMSGNVWELTASAYTPLHDQDLATQVGPNGHDPRQPGRPVVVIKGGSYLCAASYCYRYRPAARQAQDTFMTTSHIGFRVVRTPPSSPPP